MNTFETQIDLDLMLKGYDNHDVLTEKVNLVWNLELEVRSYGVRSFIVTVPEQTITVTLNMWGDEKDTEMDLTLEIKDVEILFNRGAEMNLVPSCLEYYQGKWRLVF